MKQVRNFLFWCHLLTGTIVGLFILFMLVTGALIAFEDQIVNFAERKVNTVRVPTQTQRLSPQTLMAKLKEARPNIKPSGLVFASNPSSAVIVNLGRDGVLFIDPYTGTLLGESSQQVRKFFQFVTELHRWLALQGGNRDVGKLITGFTCICFLFMALSGLYLWCPRGWTVQQLKAVLLLRLKLKGHARNFNLHNVIGFWSSLLLISITITGTIMAFQWAENFLYTITGSEQPKRTSDNKPRATNLENIKNSSNAAESKEQQSVDVISNLDKFYNQAEKQVPNWQTINLRLPTNSKMPVSFSIDQGNYWQRSQLNLDQSTAEIISWEPYSSLNSGRKLRSWTKPLHTGEALGLVGQIIIWLTAISGIFLVWTGLALTLHRFKTWSAKHKTKN